MEGDIILNIIIHSIESYNITMRGGIMGGSRWVERDHYTVRAIRGEETLG